MRGAGAYIEGMNTLFTLVFLTCAFFLLCNNPDGFLSAMLEGGSKAAATCVALIATYSVWMGLMKVWEACGIAKGVAKLVKPVAKKLLKTEDDDALEAASMNLSVNLLGISGAGTPYGISCANLLDRTENAEYASAMFFVLNATSLQLFPASMVAVRAAMRSVNPTDIVLPTLLTTVFSTILGVVLTRIFIRPNYRERTKSPSFIYVKQAQTGGAGTK